MSHRKNRPIKDFTQVQNYLIRSPELKPIDKVVYFNLISRADGKNNCFPGHKRIALESKCSVSAVKTAMQRLRKLGLVTWERRNRTQTNLYKVAFSSKQLKTKYVKFDQDFKKKAAVHEQNTSDRQPPEVPRDSHQEPTNHNHQRIPSPMDKEILLDGDPKFRYFKHGTGGFYLPYPRAIFYLYRYFRRNTAELSVPYW